MLENLLDRAVQLLWGRGTIAFTLLCGLYFTVFTHFLPLRKIGLVTQKTLGSLFCKKESKDSVSPFAAVSTALGGTMGSATSSAWVQRWRWVARAASSGCGSARCSG